MCHLYMDLELLYACVKVAAVKGLEGGPLAVFHRACLGNLLCLSPWAWGHCLVGAGGGSGGVEGELKTVGPLDPWSDKGPVPLSLSKVLSCQV